MRLLAFCYLTLNLWSCGAREKSTHPTSRIEESSVPISNQKSDSKIPKMVKPDSHYFEIEGPTFEFQALQSEERKCLGLFVSRTVFVTPSHCLPNITDRIKVFGQEGSTARLSILPARSSQSEPLSLFQTATHFGKHFEDLGTLVFTGSQPPIPFDLKLGTVVAAPCSLVRYNLSLGLAFYRCTTVGGNSGSVLYDKAGKPFALHLGTSNGLGYGVILGQIAPQIIEAARLGGLP
jgi:hypothetical protein